MVQCLRHLLPNDEDYYSDLQPEYKLITTMCSLTQILQGQRPENVAGRTCCLGSDSVRDPASKIRCNLGWPLLLSMGLPWNVTEKPSFTLMIHTNFSLPTAIVQKQLRDQGGTLCPLHLNSCWDIFFFFALDRVPWFFSDFLSIFFFFFNREKEYKVGWVGRRRESGRNLEERKDMIKIYCLKYQRTYF